MNGQSQLQVPNPVVNSPRAQRSILTSACVLMSTISAGQRYASQDREADRPLAKAHGVAGDTSRVQRSARWDAPPPVPRPKRAISAATIAVELGHFRHSADQRIVLLQVAKSISTFFEPQLLRLCVEGRLYHPVITTCGGEETAGDEPRRKGARETALVRSRSANNRLREASYRTETERCDW
eukprot:SAG31_NODE_499_length_14841_cov_7.930471_3_plen_182_part_00